MALAQCEIPGFRALVLRNGADFSEYVKSFKFVRDASQLLPGWSINLIVPVADLDPDDEWTLKLGIGGMLRTLVDSEKYGKLDESRDPDSFGITISGVGGNSGAVSEGAATVPELLEYCVPKTLVFCNPDWLSTYFPSVKLIDGILKIQQFYESEPERWYHPRLPKKEVDDDRFTVILQCRTHHQAAKYLAALVGHEISLNTPDITIVDTWTVPVGTTWWDAICSNLRLFSPLIEARDGTIYVQDVLSDEGIIADMQPVTIEPKAQKSLSVSESATRGQASSSTRSRIVDHVIVTGRTTTNTFTRWPDNGNLDITTIPEVSINPTKTLTWSQPIGGQKAEQYLKFSNYKGSFGKDETEFTPKDVVAANHTLKIYENPMDGSYVCCEKQVDMIRSDGELSFRSVRQNFFGPNLEIVRTLHSESGLIPIPGESSTGWRELRNHHVHNNHFVKAIKKALTHESIEQLVLVEVDGEGLYHYPMPLLEILRQDKSRELIDKDPDTAQRLIYVMTGQRVMELDRTDNKSLELVLHDYDLLSNAPPKRTVQKFRNPMVSGVKPAEDKETFRAEFWDGSGQAFMGYGPCYHSPQTVAHDDITDDATAQAIADRIFARVGVDPATGEGEGRYTVTLQTIVPIPFESTAHVVTLPEFTYDRNGTQVPMPEADYILRRVEESVSYNRADDNMIEIDYLQTLTMRSQL